jgi:RNA polymerase sigma factor (sigma-70 family)
LCCEYKYVSYVNRSSSIDPISGGISGTGMADSVIHVAGFDEFYRDRYRRAVRLALVLCGSVAAAEDLVQDVMADAHRKWDQLAGYDNAAAWLRRAIVNRAISRRRRMTVSARGLLRISAQTTTSVELVETDWELWALVRRLPERQAQLIALVYVDGLTIAVAAATLGISTPTAKTHLARAKQRLKPDLAEWRKP